MKTCSKCGETHPRDFFNKDRRRVDGLFPWCKTCSRRNGRKHYENNKAVYIARGSEWTKNHRDLNNTWSARWKKSHPERVCGNEARRRQLRSVEMTQRDRDMSDLRRIRIKNFPCFYCGLKKPIMHTDHFIPLVRGGTDHFWNLVRACSDCNLSKGSMTGYEFSGSGRVVSILPIER